MKRRAFGALAVLAVLPGCSSTDGSDPAQEGGPIQGSIEDAGLSSNGVEDIDAFLDVQRKAATETAHTFSLTETAEETFEDGFKANELRARYDPVTERLSLRRWWRYPDGDRSGESDIYAEDSGAGERTVSSSGEERLHRISASAARERYRTFRGNVRSLLAKFTYGPLEDASGESRASHRIPVTGVRDVDTEPPVESVGSGHLLVTEAGVLRALDIRDIVVAYDSERTSDLAFEVTNVGATTVSEPDWFDAVPDAKTTTTSEGGSGGGGDGVGGTVDRTTARTTERTTARTTEQTTARTPPPGVDELVLVGPGGELQFDPETLRITPGTTVQWVWDSDNHNVKPDDQPAGADWSGYTELSDEGTTYQHTFDVEGTYSYVCEPHVAVGMVGDIVVESE